MALGRTKIGRRRQETFEEPEVAAPDQELDSYLAALAPEEDVETTGSGRRFGGSQVYQLRLPLMANERLKELAARQGISPGALARDWVIQHLEHQAPPAAPAWPQQDTQQARQPAHSRPEPVGHHGEETDTEITIPRGGQFIE